MKNKYTLHPSVIAIIDTLQSEILKQTVKGFIQYTPIDFGVVRNGAFRTAEDQNALFNKVPRVTNCDGYKYLSKHQSGMAVDLVPYVEGEYTWDKTHCDVLAGAFATYLNTMGIEFVGGFDWNGDGNLNEAFMDSCHFEVKE
jgi:hypothetical protein